ncbi:MAG: DUF4469 domain-containing protein [Prevotellaceae bacterium]|jgi:hypothetical protein|nr:DUF4469 domain-containing protein [Prevotellaceae bacterium]
MATILHRIKAYLYDNTLTKENPDDLVARVSSERSLNVRDICESAATRGGADVSADAMEHGVNLFFKEMSYRLCDGFAVNTGWFTAGTHIKGVFNSPNEKFDPEKHTVLFEFHQGALLRKELESVEVQIEGMADVALSISQVVDVKTGSVNDVITPDRNLRIHGHKLKIAGDKEGLGVYFINQDSQEETAVDPTDIVTNNPSELVVVIPGLAAGTYKVKVTTQYSSNLLKEPRTAIFEKVLTVQ